MQHKHKILIVEDEPSIQQMYRMKLESTGFVVDVADDGQEGLEKSEEFKPDLILLDLKMPNMTGEEMLEKVRKTDWGASIRVIVLTNISRDEAPSALRMLNVDRYIVKAHYTPAQVVDAVNEVLGNK
jgi:two-component system alkaline phosphatase synthesis response regulator PhoP